MSMKPILPVRLVSEQRTYGQQWVVRDAMNYPVQYPVFNGNAKQRRQQQRKLIRDLNQE